MKKYYTTEKSYDGFGAQYQKIIQTYIYCKLHDLDFVYNPLNVVEHNYDNDDKYNDKLENCMNLKENIQNLDENMIVEYIDYNLVIRNFFEENIDLCCESEYMKFIKECFWKNKKKDYFENNKMIRKQTPEIINKNER
jgi:hypothetical protein